MKDIEYYMSLPYRLELIPDPEEGGYTARYPELSGCITCADTLQDVVLMAEDAKREWLLAAIESGYPIPDPSKDYSGQFKLRIPRSLHRLLAQHAKEEGISMNQYCLYLLSKNDSIYTP